MLRRSHILTAVAVLVAFAAFVPSAYAVYPRRLRRSRPVRPRRRRSRPVARIRSGPALTGRPRREPARRPQVAQDLRSPDARDAKTEPVTQVAQDLRSPDARDAAQAAKVEVAQDLRSPDARDAGLPEAPTPDTVVEIREVPGSGFDWGDAGIGAAGILAMLSIAGGLALMVTTPPAPARHGDARSLKPVAEDPPGLLQPRDGATSAVPLRRSRHEQTDGTVGPDPQERVMKAAFTPGTTFANYRVESLLGRGGMGVVYLAHDPSLERPVALKLIAPELVAGRGVPRTLPARAEARGLARSPERDPDLRGRRARGPALHRDALREGHGSAGAARAEGKLEPERAMEHVRQVAGALDAAHELGLVHRDVKPANVLLDGRTIPISPTSASRRPARRRLTGTGQIVGTLDYLAPEQIQGKEVDGRTDCYSLGVRSTSAGGEPPYRRDTEAATLWAHAGRARPAAWIEIEKLVHSPEDLDRLEEAAGNSRTATPPLRL